MHLFIHQLHGDVEGKKGMVTRNVPAVNFHIWLSLLLFFPAVSYFHLQPGFQAVLLSRHSLNIWSFASFSLGRRAQFRKIMAETWIKAVFQLLKTKPQLCYLLKYSDLKNRDSPPLHYTPSAIGFCWVSQTFFWEWLVAVERRER